MFDSLFLSEREILKEILLFLFSLSFSYNSYSSCNFFFFKAYLSFFPNK